MGAPHLNDRYTLLVLSKMGHDDVVLTPNTNSLIYVHTSHKIHNKCYILAWFDLVLLQLLVDLYAHSTVSGP
jgi:hypothetical protein